MHGHGTVLSGATTGVIGLIRSMDRGGLERDDIETSTMDSIDKWRTFIPGMKNAGELSMELLYKKENAEKVLTAFEADAEDWTITYPCGSTFVCSGYLRASSDAIPYDAEITQSVTLKLSGKPTFTAAGSSS